jgi:hypothetical protein
MLKAFDRSFDVSALAIKRETQQRLVDGHQGLLARPLKLSLQSLCVVVDTQPCPEGSPSSADQQSHHARHNLPGCYTEVHPGLPTRC